MKVAYAVGIRNRGHLDEADRLQEYGEAELFAGINRVFATEGREISDNRALFPLSWIRAVGLDPDPSEDFWWEIDFRTASQFYDRTVGAFLFPPVHVASVFNAKKPLGYDDVQFNPAFLPYLDPDPVEAK